MAVTAWAPERLVDATLAQALIEAQFPRLSPARVEPLGEGWDNTVFRVNGAWVFRFPRRQIAVALLETELRLLPLLPSLPLPFPVPDWRGAPEERFPWPFAGYRWLPGRTADQAALSDGQRERAARPLGLFLRALHRVDPALGGPDPLPNRLDPERMRAATAPRLEQLGVALPRFFNDEVPPPRTTTLVHGDLHARQLLVDDGGAPCGVIDWGDAHLGDPACDLAIAHALLRGRARETFRETYGEIDAGTWALSRLRGLHLCAALAVYARDRDDQGLLREALFGIESCSS